MGFAELPAPDFDLDMTLNSGQVFHWEKIDNGFCGAIGEHPVCVEQHEEILKVRDGEAPTRSSRRPLPRIIADYFALDHPLAEICESFPDDPVMNAARSYCRGLRIIRQPKWECLATFICSSMKQVAHIRQISRKLRERFGERRQIDLQRLENAHGGSAPNAFGGDVQVNSASLAIVNIEQGTARSTGNHSVFTFPVAERVARSTEKELRECALGYRAKNLLATARMVANGEADLERWAALSDVDLRAKLCDLPGVGAKVANCVMLFAYERLRAFPIDVWIERVLREKYFAKRRNVTTGRLREFAETYFGEQGGYAQQYLFHHARSARKGRRTDKVLNTKAKAVSKIDRVKRAKFVTISPVT